MKKNLFYLVALFTFFIGITECFGATITNYGAITGFDLSSGNSYTCNKDVLKLLDEGNVYYTMSCDNVFPCNASNSTDDACVGESGYIFEETKECYVTCDNLATNPSNDTDIGNYQHTIWNNLSTYQKTSCEVDRINSTDLQNAMDTLISNKTCSNSSSFYILQEYKHVESDSKVVSVKTVNSMCPPQVKIKKQCVGFSEGTFNVKVGEELISLNCGETSDPIDVQAGAEIEISEVDSENYMVYYSENLTNGKVTVNSGTEIVTIVNAVGSVNLTKINGTNKSPMNGIQFRLEKKVNGEWVPATNYKGENINITSTNNDGKLTFSGLLKGEYQLVEISDSNGNYIASDTIEFVITKGSVDSNYAQNITVENNPFKLKIKKVDVFGNYLKDSVFMIQKIDKNGVPETVSQLIIENGEADIHLEKTGHYYITEIQSPSGYDLLNDSIEIELENGTLKNNNADGKFVKIKEENNLLTIEVINDKSKIKIFKRDNATGNIISGAKLALKKADGTLVQEFTTTNGVFDISLEPGNYILSEIVAPKGYEMLKENFEFMVKEDGTIESITSSGLFEVIGMNINVYNVKPTTVPDTGIGLNIFLTIAGLSLLGGGSYLVYKNVKKRKDVK